MLVAGLECFYVRSSFDESDLSIEEFGVADADSRDQILMVQCKLCLLENDIVNFGLDLPDVFAELCRSTLLLIQSFFLTF